MHLRQTAAGTPGLENDKVAVLHLFQAEVCSLAVCTGIIPAVRAHSPAVFQFAGYPRAAKAAGTFRTHRDDFMPLQKRKDRCMLLRLAVIAAGLSRQAGTDPDFHRLTSSLYS